MKNELIAIVLLILASVFLISIIDFYKKNIEFSDAKKFVTEELKVKYPLAEIGIISVEEKNNNGTKYYEIKTRVTKNAATPCPERMHIYFNYPMQNFVSQPPEYVTKNCKVCLEKQNCPILFAEEAIIASHTMPGTEAINEFIMDSVGAYPTVTENENSWVIQWDSQFTTYYYQVEISKSATLGKVEKNSKGD